MSAPDRLHEQQFALARHLRDPARFPPPEGVEERRLAIYRDLFFNNIENLLAGNFPVIRKTLGDPAWRALVRRFYAEHRSHTPLFPQIAGEFIRFLQENDAHATWPSWLPDLAHYEWVELALQIADDIPPPHDADGDLLDGVPLASPFAWPLAYRWPVTHIGPDFQPTQPPPAPTLLLVRRDANHRVRFAALSPLAYRLFEHLQEGGHSGRELLLALATEAGAPLDDDFLAQGQAMLERMHEEGSVLGTRRDPDRTEPQTEPSR